MKRPRRVAFLAVLLTAAAGAALAADGAAPRAAEPDLRIQVECNTGHVCSATLRDAADPAMRPVTTRFQADRLDARGEWLPGVADGEFDNPKPGAYLLTFHLVEGEDGVLRNATREDPEDAIRVEKITLVLDERGHVVYFHGVVHRPQDTKVLRSGPGAVGRDGQPATGHAREHVRRGHRGRRREVHAVGADGGGAGLRGARGRDVLRGDGDGCGGDEGGAVPALGVSAGGAAGVARGRGGAELRAASS